MSLGADFGRAVPAALPRSVVIEMLQAQEASAPVVATQDPAPVVAARDPAPVAGAPVVAAQDPTKALTRPGTIVIEQPTEQGQVPNTYDELRKAPSLAEEAVRDLQLGLPGGAPKAKGHPRRRRTRPPPPRKWPARVQFALALPRRPGGHEFARVSVSTRDVHLENLDSSDEEEVVHAWLRCVEVKRKLPLFSLRGWRLYPLAGRTPLREQQIRAHIEARQAIVVAPPGRARSGSSSSKSSSSSSSTSSSSTRPQDTQPTETQ